MMITGKDDNKDIKLNHNGGKHFRRYSCGEERYFARNFPNYHEEDYYKDEDEDDYHEDEEGYHVDDYPEELNIS
ncbi:hypothetical protein BN7_2956 [Wickerhamomyces ciferrii]|uniref:Uncharacterized protein n=1 Tax=Wickerhamomyces ciferrii (strain ATCC 14091 / BCRC 22168 / CBS 111 / JCM 3599 / NBRC 0793 / NRRL Y-1031 F-60-10) TaxID=1206466 RepID=K0KQB0_WICCF|nr:uncharacterized protein BN7_2956 [Wickerhamomyces ciferrii]CCH43408.1 hypothetical protein BN7_2956 [Wickerhamomyces ciferrii]